MRIRDLFTVPDGEKVTEKAFCRVLVSSVCSILLCMGCLAGATWAWFAADVNNTDNVIAIATVTADTTVTKGGAPVEAAADGGYRLGAGEYAVEVRLNNNATDSQRMLYVLMTVEQDGVTRRYYLPFDKGQSQKTVDVTVEGTDAAVAFAASWTKPDAADLLDGGMSLVGEDEAVTTTTTTAATTATEATEATSATTVPTEPAEVTEATGDTTAADTTATEETAVPTEAEDITE